VVNSSYNLYELSPSKERHGHDRPGHLRTDLVMNKLDRQRGSVKCASHPRPGVALPFHLQMDRLMIEMDHLIYLSSISVVRDYSHYNMPKPPDKGPYYLHEKDTQFTIVNKKKCISLDVRENYH
ncbi:unnamed protein product, partial [Prunus brigantina]